VRHWWPLTDQWPVSNRPTSTLWCPLLPYGYSYKASCTRPGCHLYFLTSVHSVPGCQKITNDGLTRSGTGCFIAVPIWQQWASKGWCRPITYRSLVTGLISQTCIENTGTDVAAGSHARGGVEGSSFQHRRQFLGNFQIVDIKCEQCCVPSKVQTYRVMLFFSDNVRMVLRVRYFPHVTKIIYVAYKLLTTSQHSTLCQWFSQTQTIKDLLHFTLCVVRTLFFP